MSFKPIPGFPGYKINRGGTIKNSSGEIIKSRDDKDGYKRVDLRNGGKRFTRFVHTLVNRTFNGTSGEVDHKDNDRTNNNASNLEKVSHQENMKRLSERHKKRNGK